MSPSEITVPPVPSRPVRSETLILATEWGQHPTLVIVGRLTSEPARSWASQVSGDPPHPRGREVSFEEEVGESQVTQEGERLSPDRDTEDEVVVLWEVRQLQGGKVETIEEGEEERWQNYCSRIKIRELGKSPDDERCRESRKRATFL